MGEMETIGTMTCQHVLQWLEDRDGAWRWYCLSCGMAMDAAVPAGRPARRGTVEPWLACLALAVCLLMLPFEAASAQTLPGTVQNEAIRLTIPSRPLSPDELIAGAETGNVAAVRLLLDAGMNVNARDTRGMTALIAASEHGHAAVVKLLLDRDADIHAKNTRGVTAMMLATLLDYADVVQALKKAGAKE